MRVSISFVQSDHSNTSGLNSKGDKRLKLSGDGEDYGSMSECANMHDKTKQKKRKCSSNVIDYTNPFSIPDLLEHYDCDKYGSVTKDIEALLARNVQTLSPLFTKYPALSNTLLGVEKKQSKETAKPENQQDTCFVHENIIYLDNDRSANDIPAASLPVVIVDSDEEDDRDQRHSNLFQKVVLKPAAQVPKKEPIEHHSPIRYSAESEAQKEEEASLAGKDEKNKDRGVYVGVKEEDNQHIDNEDDGLQDIWKEMKMALECSKDVSVDPSYDEVKKGGDDCDHSFVLKDDLGYVCRICGFIDRAIETIFEFQYNKVTRSNRTYMPESRKAKDREMSAVLGLTISEDDLTATEIFAHPRHTEENETSSS
ncbi:Protein CHROMATIN REMODELING 35-like [Quillaja saponaria]|uniref:Protein CHROMATIN REMODELING 35-like n=1 Tax=Quillaja saponaria TaxID=32244 RepID=A0AAD7PCH3_QUISA|nr:Protein CHROMATIN REMODELING 35-like [Quillaja saponaria]